MVVAGVMVLDAVGKFVLGVSYVADVMSVFTVERDFFRGSFHGTVEMREAVSVPCRSALHRHETNHRRN